MRQITWHICNCLFQRCQVAGRLSTAVSHGITVDYKILQIFRERNPRNWRVMLFISHIGWPFNMLHAQYWSNHKFKWSIEKVAPSSGGNLKYNLRKGNTEEIHISGTIQGCQIWHSHVSMPFKSAPAHSTRPHNVKKALYVIISAEIPEN